MHKLLVVVLIAAIVASVSSSLQSVDTKQDDVSAIIDLASRILERAILMDKPRSVFKRNSGMIDTILNLPDLDKIGRK